MNNFSVCVCELYQLINPIVVEKKGRYYETLVLLLLDFTKGVKVTFSWFHLFLKQVHLPLHYILLVY